MEPIAFDGVVARGLGLGRKLGFPTANIALDAGSPPPPSGIYRAETSWDEKGFRAAACSVGARPTLGDNLALAIEVYVLEFSGDLYGRRMRVRLLEKIRDEQKFPSLDALREQIVKDIAIIRVKGAP